MKTGEPPIEACSKKRSSFRSLYLNMLSKLKRIINGNYFDRLFYIVFFQGHWEKLYAITRMLISEKLILT